MGDIGHAENCKPVPSSLYKMYMDERAFDWERQRAFRAVLQEGSLSGAARRLGVALATVRRRVELLEGQLGTPLFVRAPGGLIPTAAAQRLAHHADSMALAADAFARAAAPDAEVASGVIRISASDVIAIEVLPPILACLIDDHPRLSVELSVTNRNEDLLRHEADVAVRMSTPTQQQLVAQPVGAITLGLHAAPDYLARHGTPHTPDALRDHRLIGVAHDNDFVRLLRRSGLPISDEATRLRSDHDLSHLAAIRAGLGIGVCQVAIGRRDGLVRILPDQFAYPMQTFVVYHEDLRGDARIRAAFAALVVGLRAHAAAGA